MEAGTRTFSTCSPIRSASTYAAHTSAHGLHNSIGQADTSLLIQAAIFLAGLKMELRETGHELQQARTDG